MFGKVYSSPDGASAKSAARFADARDALGIAVRAVLRLARAHAGRRAVLDLARLDERMLRDIGVTRADVTNALAEPYHVDPSRVLLLRRVERRASLRSRRVAKAPVRPVLEAV